MKTQIRLKSTKTGNRASRADSWSNSGTNGSEGTVVAEDALLPPRPSHESVAVRAHAIWQAQGCPEGCEKEHWRQAEEELSNGALH